MVRMVLCYILIFSYVFGLFVPLLDRKVEIFDWKAWAGERLMGSAKDLFFFIIFSFLGKKIVASSR